MISLYGLESVLENVGERLVTCNGLTKTAKGLFITTLAERLGRPVVMVCDKAARAEEMAETLRFFAPEAKSEVELLHFPPWEVLPYEMMTPHPEVSGRRLSTLIRLCRLKRNFILVTTIEALALKIPPRDVIDKTPLKIETGDSFGVEILSELLISYGYNRRNIVEDRGEFSIRGGIIDIFQGVGDQPARIELFGDEVESIREFDPQTQRSRGKIESVSVIPFREVFYEGVEAQSLARRMRKLCDDQGVTEAKKESFLEKIRDQRFFAGMEWLSPQFFPEPHCLFDYLPGSAIIATDEPDDIANHLENFYELIDGSHKEAKEKEEPVADPESLYLSKEDLGKRLAEKEIVRLGELAVAEDDENSFTISTHRPTRYKGDVNAFIESLKGMLADEYLVILAASTAGGAQRLGRILREADMGAGWLSDEEMSELVKRLVERQSSLFEENLYIATGRLAEGFVIKSDKWAVITDDEILGKTPKVTHRSKKGRKAFGVGLGDLNKNDLVVHKIHGVGRYIGAREMLIAEQKDEYLELEYAERQKLYLPISNIELIKKYSGGGGAGEPSLDRMGGSTWNKTRAKVKKSLLFMADKLLKLAAARELGGGFKYSEDSHSHREFADTFEFEETEDQLAAIIDVSNDMEKPKAMDRLVCGDVGYGKTEVAMRAAFKAVYDGKQVALLVPTTLLAQQHYHTFIERFRSFPVVVEVLSRFRTKKEQKAIVRKAADGVVDILIGTHRLLQKDIAFKDLGLIIIDEEQRFGVTHKEKLKSFRSDVDSLTLTATPIPRTLHTSMVGIRDLSVIETPPQDRLAVQNYITTFSDKTIREAVIRELDRGGQIFFVHNKVRSILSIEKYLNKIAPEARTAVAHGQLPEKELESVMLSFMNKEVDILVTSAIIESGLDIPSANTILINRADRFGLGQLYQLRGRVGRERHRAYCYFMAPGFSGISEVAKRRLKAIEELSELGSGFRLAARDMEIRGAGNLLGPQQSGQIDAVGFDTYCDMLEDIVRELKGEPAKERFESSLNISYQGRISPEYVPGLNQRMELYNRINDQQILEDLGVIADEMRDRFGPIPEETEKLFAIMKIKILSKILRTQKVDMIRNRLILVFDPHTPIDPEKLAVAVKESGRKFKFTSEKEAELLIEGNGWRDRIGSIVDFFSLIKDRCL
ncbi:Transcription-repair coupling factor [hydrothermal vent metagenome]|uniref:Transcription-repair coupling factor n=1 Tax=hydrothermal vent metagenome TaxID=652676 RepID=A0A3B1BRP1_9ZZZZ